MIDAAIRCFEKAERCDKGGDKIRAGIEHHLNRLVIEIDPVLDRPNSGSNCVLDPIGRLSVSHHETTCCRSLCNKHIKFVRQEVRVLGIVSHRDHAARCAYFYDVSSRSD